MQHHHHHTKHQSVSIIKIFSIIFNSYARIAIFVITNSLHFFQFLLIYFIFYFPPGCPLVHNGMSLVPPFWHPIFVSLAYRCNSIYNFLLGLYFLISPVFWPDQCVIRRLTCTQHIYHSQCWIYMENFRVHLLLLNV